MSDLVEARTGYDKLVAENARLKKDLESAYDICEKYGALMVTAHQFGKRNAEMRIKLQRARNMLLRLQPSYLGHLPGLREDINEWLDGPH